MWPSRIRSATACSSTSPPRAQLTSRTPGRVFIRFSRLRTLRVCSVSGVCSVMKSARVQQRVEVDLLHAEVLRPLGREERVVGDHPHLQAMGAVGHDRADIAAADQPQHLAHELHAHEPVLLPLAAAGRAVGGGDLARQGQHQRDRVLGRGDRVAERRVHHHHAALGRGLDVDVVDADPRPADHLQPRRRGQHLGGDLGRRADRQAVELADDGQELGRLHPDAGLDLQAALLEDGLGGRAQLVGDQHPGHGAAPLDGSGRRLRRAGRGSGRTPSRARAAAPRRRRSRPWRRTRCAGRPGRRGSSGCRRPPSARPGGRSCP